MSVSAIITDGFLFTPSLIVTAGFYSATPAPVIPRGFGGSYPGKKKKKKTPQSFIEDGISVRQSLLQQWDAAREWDDEEELIAMIFN